MDAGLGVRVTRVEVQPNPSSLLEAPLELVVEFTSEQPMRHAFWEVAYVLDVTHAKCKVDVRIYISPYTYARGAMTMHRV